MWGTPVFRRAPWVFPPQWEQFAPNDPLARGSFVCMGYNSGVRVLVILAAVVGCAWSSAPAPRIDLVIRENAGLVRGGGTTRTFTLHCGPPRGTVPQPAHACSVLRQRPALVTDASSCPSNDTGTKTVTGTLNGRRVNVRFGGCPRDRIAWDRLRAALRLPSR